LSQTNKSLKKKKKEKSGKNEKKKLIINYNQFKRRKKKPNYFYQSEKQWTNNKIQYNIINVHIFNTHKTKMMRKWSPADHLPMMLFVFVLCACFGIFLLTEAARLS
jgi:hypothetical protein